MNKVTVQEVVDALNAYGAELEKVGFKKCASPTLPERIQQHGIEVAYTPMTDDERRVVAVRTFTYNDEERVRRLEEVFFARLGVAPPVAYTRMTDDEISQMMQD